MIVQPIFTGLRDMKRRNLLSFLIEFIKVILSCGFGRKGHKERKGV